MTTVYGGSVYPTSLDSFLPRLLDGVDEVIVDHQNSGYEAIENIEAKLGIDNDPCIGLGGVSFDPLGKAANPGTPGDPTVWVDNTGGPGFSLWYTDDTGVSYNLLVGSGMGLYNCPLGVAVGDVVQIDTVADTVKFASNAAGANFGPALSVVYNKPTGTTCYISKDVIIGGFAALTPGTQYFLGVDGAITATPVTAAGTISQSVGYVKNATTFAFSFGEPLFN